MSGYAPRNDKFRNFLMVMSAIGWKRVGGFVIAFRIELLMSNRLPEQMQRTDSFLTHVRGIELLPNERIRCILDAAAGLTGEPTGTGQLLVATNVRLVSVPGDRPGGATQMYAMPTVAGVTALEEPGRKFSWKQWAIWAVAGTLLYLVLSYWLVDRLPDVVIPVINMHPVALALIILLLLIGWIIWRNSVSSGGRKLLISGVGWTMELVCTADMADLITFANCVIGIGDERRNDLRRNVIPGSTVEGLESERRIGADG